jgi:Zn-dependent oligopeptidase
MEEKIYGVDLSKRITPVMVRDAIIKCFIEAHSEVLEMMKEYHEFKSMKEFEEMKQIDVELLIKSKFEEIGADFNNPTKKDLIEIIEKLAVLASNFRKSEVIDKHYSEIMQLVNKL